MRRENPCGKKEENIPFSFLSVPSVGTRGTDNVQQKKQYNQIIELQENSIFWFPCFFCGNGACRKTLSVSVSPLNYRSFQMNP